MNIENCQKIANSAAIAAAGRNELRHHLCSLPDRMADIYPIQNKVMKQMVSFNLIGRGQKRLVLSKPTWGPTFLLDHFEYLVLYYY